ncbi:MAG: helix-turn-helix domain-containing protein, partial [Christensenellaceae bacterium]|nr:helix-turn-helix domain-containing protein [Christensenellaceae bacterium]
TGFPSAYKQAETLSGNGLFPQICTVSVGGGENNAQYNRVIASAIELIGKEFGKDISIATVAKRLFVSESYLMHLFKANLGKTFNECLTGYRIVKAKELLLKSPDRVGIIAEQVGYNDVKYFASVFKKYTNMTPNEFVKARKGSAY